MLKVIDKYSDFGGWDNSDQNPLFLLLVILGWAIAQVCVCVGGWGAGGRFLLFCPQIGVEQ